MPAKSRKQQKLLFAKFGEQWVKAHHFDKIESRPEEAEQWVALEEAEEEVIVLWFVIFAVFFYLVSVMVDRWGPM
jgi:hypothetical protein